MRIPYSNIFRRSLPVRERGLKHIVLLIDPQLTESLPVRERGLKLIPRGFPYNQEGRSPCGSVD